MASSFGNMSSASFRRVTSPLRRSIGFVDYIFTNVLLIKDHESDYICFYIIYQFSGLAKFGTQAIGDFTLLLARGLGVALSKHGADHVGDHGTAQFGYATARCVQS